ncbi:MAG: type VI secretion system protein TssA [Candidatus Dactylopiibacterium sp.]|nr:type VI secretion system protein TssA [Candidatus Dactylopiibacterium sp.]
MSLSAFLMNLFGAGQPERLARERLAAWQAWVAPVPGASPVGTDPAYDDDFLALREELSKLGGLDDARILATSERLLREVCKDLRCAAYYAFARLRTDGAAGLADGLELVAALIEAYPSTILPHRAESRKAALEWLNGERFQMPLEGASVPPAELRRACSALALIERLTAAWDEPARPVLTPLLHRFEALASAGEDGAAVSAPATGGVTPAFAPSGPAEIASHRDLLERAREMAAFLRRQQEGYLPACRLLRCVRWDTVAAPPPHDGQGRTRLASPRPELQQHLRRLFLQQQWHELLDRVELAFSEGANHFWLDLQCYAWHAQGHAGPGFAAHREALLTDFAQMRYRLGGVERLCFSDGTPFCADSTLEWIARHAVIRDLEAGEELVPVPLTDAGADWLQVERQATELATGSGLESAFQWLAALPPVPGEHDRFMRALLMARLAEGRGRTAIALHLLEALDGDVDRYRLARWAPSLAWEVRAQQLRILRQRASRKDVDRAALGLRIERLTAALLALDPVRALTLAAPDP